MMNGAAKRPQPNIPPTSPAGPKPAYDFKYSPPIGKKKEPLVPIFVWVIVIVVVLAAVGLIIAIQFAPFPGPPEETKTYSSEVIISDGGHFKYDLGQDFYSVSEVTLNISSTGGGRFDVYIMDWNEYDNAYGGPNASIMSFTAHYVKENITQIDDFVELPGDGVYYYMYWLVIDNRNTPLTPDDATPTGVLTVDLTVTTKNPYYLY